MKRPDDLTQEDAFSALGAVQDALFLKRRNDGLWVYSDDNPIDKQTIDILLDSLNMFGLKPHGEVIIKDQY